MKLTRDQRDYVKDRIYQIYCEKTKGLKQLYFGSVQVNSNYPAKVNAAITTLKEYEQKRNEQVTKQIKPYNDMRTKLEEQLLFADNLEAVQAMLESFNNFTPQD